MYYYLSVYMSTNVCLTVLMRMHLTFINQNIIFYALTHIYISHLKNLFTWKLYLNFCKLFWTLSCVLIQKLYFAVRISWNCLLKTLLETLTVKEYNWKSNLKTETYHFYKTKFLEKSFLIKSLSLKILTHEGVTYRRPPVRLL